MVGIDILLRKMRYARKFSEPLINGSIWALPFADKSFDCVVCSEVIEHIEAGEQPFCEMRRVLKAGGRLVLGTPDYGPPWWRMFEAGYKFAVPGGYADEHITQYTRASLIALVEKFGFRVEEYDYILGSELILCCTLIQCEASPHSATPTRFVEATFPAELVPSPSQGDGESHAWD